MRRKYIFLSGNILVESHDVIITLLGVWEHWMNMKNTSYYNTTLIEFEDKNIKCKKAFVEIKEKIWKKL